MLTRLLPRPALWLIFVMCVLPLLAQAQGGLPKFGLQVNAGTAGAGIQAATAVAGKSNLRFGFNYFSYSGSTTSKDNNITFNGKLHLETAEVLFDQYIAGPFHISPGVAVYYGNKASGNALIPAGQTFTLNSTRYFSSAADPVTGNGTFTAGKVAPELLFGLGNLLPRSSRHFTLNFDFGVMFTRSSIVKFNLGGTACTVSATAGCSPISSTPSIQTNLQAEQSRVNRDLADYIKYWPVVRIGFGAKF